MNKKLLEETTEFKPQYDENGLIPCIVTNVNDSEVIMFAFMNAQSLELTLQTGEAHYWSRSRQSIWHKGVTSGAIQKVIKMRTDCDQDCIWISVEVAGNENATCHTDRKSCFYREINLNSKVKDLKITD